jgi:hypothetical protein
VSTAQQGDEESTVKKPSLKKKGEKKLCSGDRAKARSKPAPTTNGHGGVAVLSRQVVLR